MMQEYPDSYLKPMKEILKVEKIFTVVIKIKAKKIDLNQINLI